MPKMEDLRQKDCKILHDGTGHLLLILYAVCAHVRKNVTARKLVRMDSWGGGGGGCSNYKKILQTTVRVILYVLKFSKDRL
jgi:hypothetical protein